MSRDTAIGRAEAYFDDGSLFEDLARRVAYPTESQNEDRVSEMKDYLTDDMQSYLEKMGFGILIVGSRG
jgi:hypothetical protein